MTVFRIVNHALALPIWLSQISPFSPCVVFHLDTHSDLRDPYEEGINCGTFLMAAIHSDIPLVRVYWMYNRDFLDQDSLAVCTGLQDRFAEQLSARFRNVSVARDGETTNYSINNLKLTFAPVSRFSDMVRDICTNWQLIVDIDMDLFVRSHSYLVPEIEFNSISNVIETCNLNQSHIDLLTLCTSTDSGYFPNYFTVLASYVEIRLVPEGLRPEPKICDTIHNEAETFFASNNMETLCDSLLDLIKVNQISCGGKLVAAELWRWMGRDQFPAFLPVNDIIRRLDIESRRLLGFGWFHERQGDLLLAFDAMLNSLHMDPENPYLIYKLAQLIDTVFFDERSVISQCQITTNDKNLPNRLNLWDRQLWRAFKFERGI